MLPRPQEVAPGEDDARRDNEERDERQEATVSFREESPDEHRGAEDGDDGEEREPEPQRQIAEPPTRKEEACSGEKSEDDRPGAAGAPHAGERTALFGKNDRRISAGPQRRGDPSSEGRAWVRRWNARAVM